MCRVKPRLLPMKVVRNWGEEKRKEKGDGTELNQKKEAKKKKETPN